MVTWEKVRAMFWLTVLVVSIGAALGLVAAILFALVVP